MHVAFGRVRRKSRIVADDTDCADYSKIYNYLDIVGEECNAKTNCAIKVQFQTSPAGWGGLLPLKCQHIFILYYEWRNLQPL